MDRFLEWSFLYFSEGTVDDRVSGVTCLQEREIEDLVRGKLSSSVERRCQAHLLWCQSCQNRVEEEADFAQATRSAAVLLQQQEAEAAKGSKSQAVGLKRVLDSLRNLFSTRVSMRWAAVGVSAGVLIAMASLLPLRRGTTAGQEVDLRSERGSAVPVAVDSAAGANIRLRIDVTDVVPSPAFNVAVVDAGGRAVETNTASATAGSLNVALHAKLTPGRYWVRLSATDGRLLREYALRVRP
jgi:hypothetical protein